MNTNKTVLSIIDKLKPAKKAVELSIVNDIDSSFDWLEQSYSEASYGVDFMAEWEQKIYDFSSELSIAVDNYVINGAAYSFQEEAQNMQAKIDELEVKADELGIMPEDLISNYEEIKEILNNADSVDTEFRNAYKEVLKASNNLPLADFS
tara:strand:- start:6279 stop:6728 length:450 start_codon:yes stop_codon:yes gene_type:complete